MAKRKSNARVQRRVKTTVLIYTEGKHEAVFLECLRNWYTNYQRVHVTIKHGNGGGPHSLILRANKVPGTFNKRIVVLDHDKSDRELKEANKYAREYNIETIFNQPCLEKTLLDILVRNVPDGKSSKWYKTEFERKYISGEKRNDIDHYQRVFTKQNLDAKARNIKQLDFFIKALQGLLS